MSRGGPSFDIVVPTVGRPCLAALLEALALSAAAAHGARPGRTFVVDDRPGPPATPLVEGLPSRLPAPVEVLQSGGAGPAAARNLGWRASAAEWIAFLDDDVVLPPDWLDHLAADLVAAGTRVGGSQGRIRVPLPTNRRPTDWERNVAGLEHAQWATADLAYRRDVLAAAGGFDERFPRAYREDADLGLRVTAARYEITTGSRTVLHPVRPASPWVSVRLQAGNADDAFMTAIHGSGWRQSAGVPTGRRRRHLAT
ncbi:MAG: glycosyltransferase, partial [Actinomycetota bacterium]|nr:glycosyltransferase [Actinomycetota bacterium]